MKQSPKDSDFRQPSSNQMKKILKTKKEPSKTTMVPGQKMKTKHHLSPLQNKSNRKQCNAPGKKKPPWSQSRKN